MVDVCVPFERGLDDAWRAELFSIGWSCAALECVVDAEQALRAEAGSARGQKRPRPSELSDPGDDGSDDDALAPRTLRAQLPSAAKLREVLGAFPTTPLSERTRHKDADGLELYSRITIRFAGIAGLHAALRDPVLGLFDLVALRVETQAQLSVALGLIRSTQESPGSDGLIDALQLALGPSEPPQMPLKLGSVDMLMLRRARVFVELNYTEALPTRPPRVATRQFVLRSAQAACEHASRGGMRCSGRARHTNVVLSSGAAAENPLQLRAPADAAAIGRLFGLRHADALAAVTNGAQALLLRAERRRAVRVRVSLA